MEKEEDEEPAAHSPPAEGGPEMMMRIRLHALFGVWVVQS
jgi:hypothetical protein